MFFPPKRADREFLDTPGQDPTELWGLLLDIRRMNLRFGGRRLIIHYLDRVAPLLSHRPVTILDVATASADIPRAIVEWARHRRLTVRIVALDINPDILGLARRGLPAYPEITLTRGDALHLPFSDQSFDLAISGLALHHFTYDQAVQVLREIHRVARGFIVNDIARSWPAYAGAWLDTRLFSRNRLARHDGPLSVLRSFTLEEFRAIVATAGLADVVVHRHPVFRVALAHLPDPRSPRPAPAPAGSHAR